MPEIRIYHPKLTKKQAEIVLDVVKGVLHLLGFEEEHFTGSVIYDEEEENDGEDIG